MKFEEWYNNRDFTMLEAMKPEFHREYYCRSAWFQRDVEIALLEQRLAEAKSKGMGVSAECSVLEQQLREVYTMLEDEEQSGIQSKRITKWLSKFDSYKKESE